MPKLLTQARPKSIAIALNSRQTNYEGFTMEVRSQFVNYIRERNRSLKPDQLKKEVSADGISFQDSHHGKVVDAFWKMQHHNTHLDSLQKSLKTEEFSGLPTESTEKALASFSSRYEAEDIAHKHPGGPTAQKLVDQASEKMGFLLGPGGDELDMDDGMISVPLYRQASNPEETRQFGLLSDSPSGILYIDTDDQVAFLQDLRKK